MLLQNTSREAGSYIVGLMGRHGLALFLNGSGLISVQFSAREVCSRCFGVTVSCCPHCCYSQELVIIVPGGVRSATNVQHRLGEPRKGPDIPPTSL